MKTIRLVVSVLTLLSLTAVGLAAEIPRSAHTKPPTPAVHNECVDGIRMPGEYMGPDGVKHHIPKIQPCTMKPW
jgi:hypothetical protein